MVGCVTREAIYRIKYVINELHLFNCTHFIDHLEPNLTFDIFDLVDDLLLVQIRILIFIDNDHALEEVK